MQCRRFSYAVVITEDGTSVCPSVTVQFSESINVMTSWKQENYNYRFHEILKVQPFCYSKNDISGHSQEIYISKVGLTTFQPDPFLLGDLMLTSWIILNMIRQMNF